MEQIYTPKQDYKVLCLCYTYNQSKYIEDTLNGFAMQKTDFSFACLVVEDCSTDGEQDVIKAWLERECDMLKAEYIELELSNVILVPHKTNSNCTFAIYLLKRNLWKEPVLKDTFVTPWREHAQYVAFCEGDDYWIDSLKLSKQVAVMGSDPRIGLCYTLCKVYNESKRRFSAILAGGNEDTNFETLVVNEPVTTLTSMFRADSFSNYLVEIEPFKKTEWLMGDTPQLLWFAANYKVVHIKGVTAVYRVLMSSASHLEDLDKYNNFNTSARDIRLYFWEKYRSNNLDLKQKIWDEYYRTNLQDGVKFSSLNFCFTNFFKIRHKNKSDYKNILKLVLKFFHLYNK